MKIKLNILFHLLILTSCNKKETSSKFDWTDISIRNSYEEIIVYKDLDTASFIKPIYENIDGNIFAMKLIRVDRKRIKFTQSEKDSIAHYVLQIIKNPVELNIYCTDYVGNLNVKISNSNLALSANYKSVCQVDTISAETKKLFKLLNSRINFADN